MEGPISSEVPLSQADKGDNIHVIFCKPSAANHQTPYVYSVDIECYPDYVERCALECALAESGNEEDYVDV